MTPDYDFRGNLVQDLADQEIDAQAYFYSSIATDAGGALCLSWFDGDQVSESFVASLLETPQERIPDALLRLMFVTSDNLCIAPEWWSQLTRADRDQLLAHFGADLDPHALPSASALLDDGLSVAAFSVTRVSRF